MPHCRTARTFAQRRGGFNHMRVALRKILSDLGLDKQHIVATTEPVTRREGGRERDRMRLICPNCDAQYEVAEDAIPTEGRDVQCSNCGHAWFQEHASIIEAREEAEALNASVMVPEPAVAPEPEPEPPSEPEPQAPEPEPEAIVEAEPDPAPAPAVAPVRRSGLDESLMAVLREEAERETQARAREEPRALEVQGDLGLETVGAVATPAARRIARLKGIEDEPQDEAEIEAVTARSGKGRDLLPDIEEINSTLRPSSERDGAGDLPSPAAQARGSSFRTGFALMLLIAVGLAAAYVLAPKVGQQIPALAEPMAAYVGAVNAARLWLDGLMQSAIAALQG
ncbi:hypothetical protein D2N39_06110 [Gemmobacter lutimaris]|uniref:Zinc finger/thioredoxin putative domain-containing protein n=2 Tax=Gemmobacter lutimaris TaxID=2306023 RepID=A0A398BWB8_9RHOB|nr:hypothetical protein D2N39_06110 [Gemmobacter lutimaris]